VGPGFAPSRMDVARRAGGEDPADEPEPNLRTGCFFVSTRSSPRPHRPDRSAPAGERTLERRLLGWLLALTVAPALIVLGVGGWALATSLDIAGSLGPWEEVAVSGREVVELAEPVADSALGTALAEHRDALSRSLTQARRWTFLGERFVRALPWLILLVALARVMLAYAATRQLASQLAHPIEELVALADRMGRGEPLPPPAGRSVHEVKVLDAALRNAAGELGEARERAVAAERVRVWGEMARRVAHEMKNPLTPLRFAAHRLVRGGSVADDGGREAVEVIDQEVARLEELAAQFSSLGRPPEGPATDIDLRELLASLLETDAAGIGTTLDAPDDLPLVHGHFDPLFRGFRNIVRNAVEAMEQVEAPELRVRITEAGSSVQEETVPPTDPVGGVDESGDEGPRAAGRWIEVRIADNGPGLPAGVAERIFEPDFTTKTRGTGLGLALVRQAVVGDGGTVSAGNTDTGAVFIVRLPAANDDSQEPL
jgi:nitrogen fixation/metabolism regulation signal transduction histidine kinase